ncbi:multimerin-1 isoform X2 [Hemicordylus capensis]|uniref:multimerin-1 isoform X2 n=1 Tax=Hemicordylus capensis TaxID=884348 RepID=UPI002304AAD4|nr:multimerin-1 isoform X2 [Hemicordylus capensis]
MKKIFLMFLLSLEWRSTEANSTGKDLVTPVDADVETTRLTFTETQSPGDVVMTLLPPASEKTITVVNTDQDGKHSTPLPMRENQGLQTPANSVQENKPSTLTTPKRGISDDSPPNAKVPGLTNNPSLINPRNSPLQRDAPNSQKGITANRSSRHMDYSGSKARQNPVTQKPSFETTRGKNWCAYVHTRLQPTIVVDNVQSYVSGKAKPCSWITGPCGTNSQSRTHQAYRIKHMIVTSLEWRCCPGYSGGTCQPTAQQNQLLIHSNQAESNAAVNEGTPGDQRQRRQQQDPSNPVAQKMNEQINSQEMKLTLLQKKVDNISVVMSDVSKTLSSLEGKINEDKGRDFQAFLKGLKSKSINELIKDIVREQLKVFQSEMQETVAQIYRSVSVLSEDLESTKELVKHLNASQQKLATEVKNRPTRVEILDIRTQILHIEEEISLTCESPIKDLQEKQKTMEIALEHQSSKSDIYYESLNRTLSQMKEVHEQLLSAEQVSDQNIPTAGKSVSDNITDYMISLHDKVKTQSLMVLQLYDDLRVHDSKISNLTVALEIQRDYLQGVCDDRLSECKVDFTKQLKGAEENMHSIKRTLENLVFPLEDKIDKMKEQVNDLCYDMEILQPLIEQGVPFSLPSEYEQQIETEAMNKKLENLTSVMMNLSSTVKELTQNQKELKGQVQAHDEVSERRINECFVLMEDGLNKTMVVINSAIDSIQDNYVLKETLYTFKNETETCAENIESVLTLIPQFQQMNESLQILVNENQKRGITSERTRPFSGLFSDEPDIPHLKKDHQDLNTTNLQEYKQDSGHQLQPTQELKDHEVRLKAVEAKIAKFLANNCVTERNVKAVVAQKDKIVSAQLQALSSRIRALEAKSIRISVIIPLLNKTAYEAQGLCQEIFGSLQKMNTTIPRLVKGPPSDSLLFQKGFQELTESMLEIKAGMILSNLTWYVNKSLADAVDTVTKRLKTTPQVVKKPPGKKIPMNTTTNQAGRSQRNTDTTLEAGEHLSCSSSPCQNGGTCVNERNGFVCACRYPFGGSNCSTKMAEEGAPAVDFTKGSYRYAPMVAFFASHTYGMNSPGPIRFNNLDVNYGSSYVPANGRFRVPYLGVYVFEYNIESNSPLISGYLVVDGVDKLAFQSGNTNNNNYIDRVVTGDALLELNYGQEVWLKLETGSIPARYPPVTTFSGYLLYRT